VRIFADGILKGRRALISGGGSGIGYAIARQLGQLGASVILAARGVERLAVAAKSLRELGIDAIWSELNIRAEGQVTQLFEELSRSERTVDILVNNAGGQFSADALDISPNGFRSVVDLNLNGTWLMSHGFARYLRSRGNSGRIVNIVLSITSGAPCYVHAGAARAGVINMTRTLAVEWAKIGITVNGVAPGVIDSEGLKNYDPASIANTVARLPIARLGREEEVAAAVAFLVSDAATYITGETLFVDGGKQLAPVP